MRITAAILIAALVLTAGCSSDEPSQEAGAAPSSEPTSSTPSETVAAAGPLEGVWTAQITPEAFSRAIEAAGYPAEVGEEVAADLPGPEFRLEVLGDRFRLSYAPTDEQFQSGTLVIDADRMTLDDEAESLISFVFTVDGDSLRFGDATALNPEIEMAPGVPDVVPAIGFYAATEWTRSS